MGTKLFLRDSNGAFLKNASGAFIYKALPSAYQEVEYIEGGSGQYLATNLNFNHNTFLEIRGKSYISASGERACIASEYSGGSNLSVEVTSGLRLYNNGSPDFTNSGLLFNNISSYSISFNRTAQTCTITCNGTVVSKSALYGNSGTTFNLFVDKALRFTTFNKIHRLYYFNIIKDNLNYCYLIPCYRKSDNVIGMYDLIGNKFYTNQGTGAFAKGANVD